MSKEELIQWSDFIVRELKTKKEHQLEYATCYDTLMESIWQVFFLTDPNDKPIIREFGMKTLHIFFLLTANDNRIEKTLKILRQNRTPGDVLLFHFSSLYC